MIDRRTLLRGMGAAVALPTLEAMLPLTALAQSVKARPNRMAFLFVPNGMDIEAFTPATEGANYALSPLLQPLAEYRRDFSVLTGLAQHNAFALGDGPGDHARSSAAWLTGVHPKKTAGSDIRNGISADQVAAAFVGKGTRFPSLELGCERSAQAGDCDSGYSCAYSSCISWRSETLPNAKEVNPRAVFERLFGGAGEDPIAAAKRRKFRHSVLDYVAEEAQQLRGKLGSRDQQKLDEYLAGVREVEARIEKYEASNLASVLKGVEKPQGVPADFGEHIRLMGDMMVLAFQADLTRICTFMIANDGSNRSYGNVGVPEGHHDMSHHGHDAHKLAQKRRIDQFHMEQFAYVLGRMKGIKELDGTMLDNSMIVYGAGISDGDRHNHDNLPILLAGRGAGTLKPGSHRRFEANTPMNNLFLSLLDRMNVPIEKLGDSTGKLQGLL